MQNKVKNMRLFSQSCAAIEPKNTSTQKVVNGYNNDMGTPSLFIPIY